MNNGQVGLIDEPSAFTATVVLAFSADPFVRWMLPQPAQFLQHFTTLARLHGQRTAASGGAFGHRDTRGAAFWYPPGIHPDGQALGAVLQQAGVWERFAKIWERVADFEPERPHWYLRQIGVDPLVQGKGYGSELMQAALSVVDQRHEPAYLEATTAPSRRFYERFGFAVLGEVQVGDSPPLWPMLRDPQ